MVLDPEMAYNVYLHTIAKTPSESFQKGKF